MCQLQSEPWLSVHAYFGFHVLRGLHDIAISRQQNTHLELRSDVFFEVSLYKIFTGNILTENTVVKTREHREKHVMELVIDRNYNVPTLEGAKVKIHR